MVYPWMLQESLGMTGSREPSKRVRNPTNATPATFSLNWYYSENGPTDPKVVRGVSTFMGVPSRSFGKAGTDDDDDRDEKAVPLQKAIQLLRKAGLSCTVPPEDYDAEDETEATEKEPAKDPELAYLREYYDEGFEMKKDNETVIHISASFEWLEFRCASDSTAVVLEEALKEHFSLGRVRYEEKTIPIRDDSWVELCTGEGTGRGQAPGTLFELKKAGKVISKCLCSYSNGEMGNDGPTIELFETAEEWRRHGYGSELMAVVQGYFEEIFEPVERQKRVKFNVCYVTNRQA